MSNLLNFQDKPNYKDDMAFLYILVTTFARFVAPLRLNAIVKDRDTGKITEQEANYKISAIQTRVQYLDNLRKKLQATQDTGVNLAVDEWLYLKDFFNNPAVFSSLLSAYCKRFEILSISGRQKIELKMKKFVNDLQEYIKIAETLKIVQQHADTEEQQDITEI